MKNRFVNSLLVLLTFTLLISVVNAINQISLDKKFRKHEIAISQLKKENKESSQDKERLPEAFGGVGYISKAGEDYIDVVGYGRFLITADESQFLDKGDKVPQYILERGVH